MRQGGRESAAERQGILRGVPDADCAALANETEGLMGVTRRMFARVVGLAVAGLAMAKPALVSGQEWVWDVQRRPRPGDGLEAVCFDLTNAKTGKCYAGTINVVGPKYDLRARNVVTACEAMLKKDGYTIPAAQWAEFKAAVMAA